jgi:hypothetical protein
MSLVKLPVKPLAELSGVANGRVPAHLLVEVGPKGLLLAPVARAFKALQFRCLGIGIALTYTWGGTYRDFAGQLNLFLRRYEPVSMARYFATPSSRRKRWHDAAKHGYSSTYWVKKLVDGKYPATAAAPGTSNHGLAIAIDTAYDRDPSNGISPADAAYIGGHPKWDEYQRLVLEFGFSFELDSEKWHIRFCAGNTVPQAVLDVENFIRTLESKNPPTYPPPAPLPPVMWDPARGRFGLWPFNANKPAIALGAKGDVVRYLQGVIATKAGGNIAVDGDFGAQTERRVRDIQQFFKLTADGWVGPQTWRTIDMLAGLK